MICLMTGGQEVKYLEIFHFLHFRFRSVESVWRLEDLISMVFIIMFCMEHQNFATTA